MNQQISTRSEAEADQATTATMEEPDYESLPQNFSLPAHMLAGAVAGIVEHSAFYPVDTVKTRLQILSSVQHGVGEAIGSGGGGVLSRVTQHPTVRSVVFVNGGISTLWKGVGSMLIGAGPAHALYFATYEEAKVAIGNRYAQNPVFASAAAGALATLVHDAFMNPFDVIKQRMQVGYASLTSCSSALSCTVPQSSLASCAPGSPTLISGGGETVLRYRSIWHCLTHTIRSEGFGALYISYPTTLVMSIPFQMIHFAMYEYMRSSLHPLLSTISFSLSSSSPPTDFGYNPNAYSPLTHAVSGAIAGATAALVTTPLDVSKTLLQTRAGSTCPRIRSSKTLWDAMKIIYSREGFAGFGRGAVPRVVGAMPSAGLSWLTYEYCKWMLKDRDYFDYGSSSKSSN